MRTRFGKTFLILVVSILLFCQPAHADAGIPMLVLMWPASWALLFLIIPLEAYIALLAGIPITWFILFGMELLVALLGHNYAWRIGHTLLGEILTVFITSP